jgi:hypothetical protein
MLLVRKCLLGHRERHLELARDQLGCYRQKLAENVVAMNVPRKVVSVQESVLFMAEVCIPLQLVDTVFLEDLRDGLLRLIFRGSACGLALKLLVSLNLLLLVLDLLKDLALLDLCIIISFLL